MRNCDNCGEALNSAKEYEYVLKRLFKVLANEIANSKTFNRLILNVTNKSFCTVMFMPFCYFDYDEGSSS